MTITALVTGKLTADPLSRTSTRGKPFATAQLAVGGDGESTFGSVIAFGTVRDQLLALGKGDAVAIVGRLKPTAWTAREGEQRVGFDLLADRVLTVYHVRRRRAAIAEAEGSAPAEPARAGAGDGPGMQEGDPWPER